MKRFLGLLYVGLVLALTAAWMVHGQQQSSNFQGKVDLIPDPQGKLSHYHFSPGSRTKWHSHEKGQMLLVEEGVGRTQLRGKQVQELRAGEVTYGPPGVPHWHGASPAQSAVIYGVSRGMTTWMGEVSDQEYNAAPAKR
jgi:quercetin dioxygenase-like cupin family protein